MECRILYCHCAYARVVPPEVKAGVLEKLAASGTSFEAVPDLCEMSARKDPRLQELATGGALRIAACYPRAVKWLFSAAGSPFPAETAEIFNMRTASADDIVRAILPAPESPT